MLFIRERTFSLAQKKTTKRTTKKTGAAKKPAGSAVKVVKDSSIGSTEHRQAWAVVIFAAALLLMFIVLIPGHNVWNAVHLFLRGLFGPGVYLWPVLLVAVALMAALERPFATLSGKLWESALLIAFVCGLIHVFAVGPVFTKGIGFAELYQKGKEFSGGGVVGGLFGGPLYMLFGKAGAAITLFLLVFVFIVLITGVTLMQIFSLFVPSARKGGTQAGTPGPVEPETRFFRHKKPKFNINIDLGPETGQALPPAAGEKPAAPFPVKNEPAAPKAAPSFEPPAPKVEKKKPDPSLDTLVSRAAGATEKTAPVKGENPFLSEDKNGQQAFYSYPPLSLLKPPPAVSNEDISDELKANASRLTDTLRSFGVETRIINISRGPAVTRYELQPSAGVKISKITSLADDIALNLAAGGVRIEAPIPNKAAVGIEVPNKTVSVVNIRDTLDTREFREAQSKLTIALGRDIAGNVALADVGKMPHVLIAGATGSGKSVCINSIIISLLYKATPEEVRFLMVDPKVVELGVYNGIPHLLVPVVTDPRKAAGALGWAVSEMLNRYKTFAENNVRDIRGFNALARQTGEFTPMPQVVIIIDELADLMMAAPNDVEDAICRLAQMARAAGMHLVIATQRPSVDVITGVIKANIPSRIAFAVSSQVDSRTILDAGGAEKLLGRGDMLFLPIGASKPVRVQGCYVSDREVEDVIDYVKKDAAAEYSGEIMDEIEKQAQQQKGGSSQSNDAGEDGDEMLPAAIECVVEAGMASTSLLQRRLKLGYARAARIIDEMEARGVVGPFEGSKPRQVLMSKQQLLEMQLSAKE